MPYTAGRSLHSSEGVVLWSPQTDYLTAVAPVNPVGICEFNATDDGDFRQFFTVGKKNLHKNKPGIAKVAFQVRVTGVGSKDLMVRALRDAVSHQVPWTTWGFGSDAVDASPEAWQVQDSKIDTFEISLDGGGVMSLALQGIGGQKSTLTNLTADAGDDDPLMSYEVIVVLDGDPFEVKGLKINGNQNLTAESVVRGAAVSDARLRIWDYLTEGNEHLDGSVTLSRVYPKDFQAPCPAHDGDLVLTCTPQCAGDPFAITLTDVEFLSQARNMPQDGYGHFELNFNAKGIDIT